MESEQAPLEGLIVVTPDIFNDNRGYFFESYQEDRYTALGIPHLVQDNESVSMKDVLRGLHYQTKPYAQGKLIRVIRGSILDVAVDIRPMSKTYGKYFKILLSAENKKQFWIPAGFAHGFLSLEDNTCVAYKCSSYYKSESEHTLAWDDAEVGIVWGVANPIISTKDSAGISLQKITNMLHS